jgi:hypothetical protein
MLWHIRKEDFATEHLFRKTPRAKGAVAGPPGSQAWAIWTHRYYSDPTRELADNVLYILRLVVEGDPSANKPLSSAGEGQPEEFLSARHVQHLEAVIRAAQAEAAKWRLDQVQLWGPSPLVRRALAQADLVHTVVKREEECIASGLWYDGNGKVGPAPEWINNEYYAWL